LKGCSKKNRWLQLGEKWGTSKGALEARKNAGGSLFRRGQDVFCGEDMRSTAREVRQLVPNPS